MLENNDMLDIIFLVAKYECISFDYWSKLISDIDVIQAETKTMPKH